MTPARSREPHPHLAVVPAARPASAPRARCRRRLVVGEPCPACWTVLGEDAGGGRPARRTREPTRAEVLLGGLSAAAEVNAGLRETIGGFEDIDAETGKTIHMSGLVDLVVRLDVARVRAQVEHHREQEALADEWRRARAVEWERAEAAEEELAIVLASEARMAWAVRVLAGRLDAALAALPAIEAATATGRRAAVVAALEPLAAALRGERG